MSVLTLLAALALAAPNPEAGAASPAPASGSAEVTPARIPLDTASVADLSTIEGVTPGLAQSIVDMRTRRGGLSSVEELRVIPGITGDALDRLRERTTVPYSFPLGADGPFTSADQVLHQFDGEPSVQQVQDWANEYAHTSPELVQRWLRQSKLFGALPDDLTVEYRLRTGYDFGYDYYLPDGSDPTNPDDADTVFSVLGDAGEDADAYYTARGSWDLSTLVMSSERIRVISEVQDVVKLRDKVLSDATSIYFERRRLQVDMLLAPKADVRGQVVDRLRLMELTANLDALTGGQFSQSLKE